MPELERAKVFMTDRSQAVRIAAQYRFKTDEVYIRQDPHTGEITLSERSKQPSLTEIFKMLDNAGEAEGAFELVRNMRLPEEREWMSNSMVSILHSTFSNYGWHGGIA